MARSLYDPEDCESERTVIISELQGGENDPDQFLDQELTAAAFNAHPYKHPTIGWLSDLQTMTREDLYGYYRRYYIPNNATLVLVGDVETESALKRIDHHFGSIPAGPVPERIRTTEPRQASDRRLTIRKEGTAAYLKVGYHAPAVSDPGFVPALLLDAVLTGAKGVNLWSSFRTQPPQRKSRLYRALVEHGAASTVSGAMLPTEQPFLYTVSVTAMEGMVPDAVESILLDELLRVARTGVTDDELSRAKTQLLAQLVFDQDSVTNVAHQFGYFETIGGGAVFESLPQRIATTTTDEVGAVAEEMFRASNRTLGWFLPDSVGDGL
jgi:zinc protease